MIRYHGTPLWPEADMVRCFAGMHAMVSFEHPEQLELAAEICPSIVLDNGAFTAWKKKRKHDFAGYSLWVEKWLKHPSVDWCLIPDVIDGTEAQNDDLLVQWPFDGALSVPVYHMHESLDRLERLVSTYPRVALGSSGDFAELCTPAWWQRMAAMAEVMCDEEGMPRCKLHGLRMLDPVVFTHVPLSSADSTNVARNVGIDKRWKGPYPPRSHAMRALVMMDRINTHASAFRWCGSAGVQANMELFG